MASSERRIRPHHPLMNAFCAGIAVVVAGCAPGAGPGGNPEAGPADASSASRQPRYLAPGGEGYDLITPMGISVRTNDQYKTAAQRRAAAATIDRYWRDVRKCVLEVVPPGDVTIVQKLLPEFPQHLSIEIASDWKIIEGPMTHRRQQAFPSLRQPGAFVTATREEEALYVKVVPELNGLGRQMSGELNLWLSGNTNTLPTDLSNVCVALPCYRFAYDNAPSQAWQDCRD
jgi:hypothetical protein